MVKEPHSYKTFRVKKRNEQRNKKKEEKSRKELCDVAVLDEPLEHEVAVLLQRPPRNRINKLTRDVLFSLRARIPFDR